MWLFYSGSKHSVKPFKELLKVTKKKKATKSWNWNIFHCQTWILIYEIVLLSADNQLKMSIKYYKHCSKQNQLLESRFLTTSHITCQILRLKCSKRHQHHKHRVKCGSRDVSYRKAEISGTRSEVMNPNGKFSVQIIVNMHRRCQEKGTTMSFCRHLWNMVQTVMVHRAAFQPVVLVIKINGFINAEKYHPILILRVAPFFFQHFKVHTHIFPVQ